VCVASTLALESNLQSAAADLTANKSLSLRSHCF
jgi:hypothetical protein